MSIEVDLLSQEAIANPYPLYQQLREHDPVHWDGRLNGWVLTRYADIQACLRDRRLSAHRVMANRADLPPEVREAIKPLDRSLALWILFQDPPDHTRLRNLMNKGFSPRVIDDLRLQIETLVDELLSSFPEEGAFDIVEALAYPLPAMVIAKMLGVPKRDVPLLKQWSDDWAFFFASGRATPENALKANRAVQEMNEYLAVRVAEKRLVPGIDLMSALLAAEDSGVVLNDDELLANCAALLFAGHETTSNLIGNAMLALLSHPDQLDKARDDSHMVSVVEECLRYDSPVQLISRTCIEDFDCEGRNIRSGDKVIFSLGGANRDPARFADPDSFDVTRTENRHLSFSGGGHFCLGAPLARVEARAAISGLLQRFPQMELSPQKLSWRPHIAMRGLMSLRVETHKTQRGSTGRNERALGAAS